jgi:hypothetical protein
MKKPTLVLAGLMLAGCCAAYSKPGLAHDLSLSGAGNGIGLIELIG